MVQTSSPIVSRVVDQAVKGTDPGKLKKIWFVGALVDDPAQLRRLGFAAADLLLFLDAFDVIVQRPLNGFAHAWSELVRQKLRASAAQAGAYEAAALVLLAEHNCWVNGSPLPHS